MAYYANMRDFRKVVEGMGKTHLPKKAQGNGKVVKKPNRLLPLGCSKDDDGTVHLCEGAVITVKMIRLATGGYHFRIAERFRRMINAGFLEMIKENKPREYRVLKQCRVLLKLPKLKQPSCNTRLDTILRIMEADDENQHAINHYWSLPTPARWYFGAQFLNGRVDAHGNPNIFEVF